MTRSKTWALEGAAAGGAVSAAFWSWTGVGLTLIAAAAGVALGAYLGVAVGSGRVQKAWAGDVGAFLIPGLTLALLNVVALTVLLSHGA